MRKTARKLRRLAVAVLAVWIIWTAVTHPDPRPAYCGSCGHHVSHRAVHRHAVSR